MDYSVLLIEGVRVNIVDESHALGFRLNDYVQRMFKGWKQLGLSCPWTPAQVLKGMVQCVQANLEHMKKQKSVQSMYVRPKIFHADALIKPMAGSSTRISIECFPLGNYVSDSGVTATLADYFRAHRYSGYETKGAGKYVEYGMLRDSTNHTYEDVFQLGLGKGGKLIFTEGTTSNLFFVKDGELYTPGMDDFILHGMTRDSVLKMAKVLGIRTHEGEIPLSLALEAEEIFLTGTASFITPVVKLGRYTLPIGPVTKKLSEFFGRVRMGKEKQFSKWLTPFTY
ncbi:aminotransferase class IV [Candidatus Gracilibacteria bacterium]|nr:aminotransferase class IV [Candidatus Gracilibacteria bacterium]